MLKYELSSIHWYSFQFATSFTVIQRQVHYSSRFRFISEGKIFEMILFFYLSKSAL